MDINETDEHDVPSSEGGSRRDLLKGATFLGAGVAAGAVAGGVAGASAGGGSPSRKRFSFEVACLGDTARVVAHPVLSDAAAMDVFDGSSFQSFFGGRDASDLRGSPWWVEGWIYPTGTIRGDGFIPTEEGRIGSWFCRGHMLISADRPDPHVATVQEYYFGGLEQDPLGSEMLISQGVEGRNAETWSAVRVVAGGTGRYRAARGEVTQTQISINSIPMPPGPGSPNFRFDFDVDIP